RDRAIDVGMGGGLVVDTQGRLVGLTGPGADHASSTSVLTELLRGRGIDASLAPYDRNYRTGLDRYFAGDYGQAVTFLRAVVDTAPTNGQAAEYMVSATGHGELPTGDPSILVVIAWICAGITVLTVATLVTVRRRQSTKVDDPDSQQR
ncbi:hypothetical protein ACFQ1S_43435, partial [Kibdelosporangium lantanae]